MEDDRRKSLLSDALQAHLLRFARPLAPTYGDAAGARVLLTFVAVAFVLFLALRWAFDGAGWRGLPAANLGFVAVLLLAFFAGQRAIVRVPAGDVGLRPVREWTRRERLYLLQVVPVAAIAFALVFRAHLAALIDEHGVGGFVLFSVLTGFAWGALQEFLYRGWLQTELTRRFGAVAGLLAANVVFTFGPLHFAHLLGAAGPNWPMLAAVFGIGLVFGVVYLRSGNVWIPAVLHGLWPLNMG
jgi:membrane protease YdiL (CAAX protease family)